MIGVFGWSGVGLMDGDEGLFVGEVLCFQRLGAVFLGCQGMAVGLLFFLCFCFFVSRVQDKESWGQ